MKGLALRLFLVAGLAAMSIASVSPAQPPVAPQQLTLERIFASPALTGKVPRAVKLSPDGKLVTLLRNRPDDIERYDLWAIDPTTGRSRMLVDSKKAGSGAELSEAEKMQRERARLSGLTGIVAYDWAPDGQHLLVPIDGDLYLADLDGNIRRLTDTKASELDGTVSEKGRYVSFVRDNRFHVLDLASMADRGDHARRDRRRPLGRSRIRRAGGTAALQRERGGRPTTAVSR